MISKNGKREPQIQMVSLEQLVLEEHLLRKIDAAVDFDFIYELFEKNTQLKKAVQVQTQ